MMTTTTTTNTICTFKTGPWEWGWGMGFLTDGHALMVTMVATVTYCVLCEVCAKGEENI
jgi:hypothetical protein